MKKIFISISLIYLLSHLQPLHAQQSFTFAKTPEEVGFSTEKLKNLDKHFQSVVEEGVAPNILTFVAKKGKIVHNKAFGFSNLEKKTPLKKDDIFRIASQTKLLTTIGLLMLFEEGKFFLDEPISKYIPAFKNPKVLESFDSKQLHHYVVRPAKSEITIRQLLSHSAGIPYEYPLQDLPEFKVPYYCSTEGDVLKDVVNKIAARPLVADPGTQFVYGLNTDVLGRLIEVLSGMRFDEYLRTKVIEPLGLKDTYFYLPKEKAPRLVELYSKATTEDKQKFFIAYARMWCNVATPSYITRQLKTDPHSLGKERINQQVIHIDGFYEAFNCKKGDKMFVDSGERIRIW